MNVGSLPFVEDSMLLLMFQVANKPHPYPQKAKMDLPAYVVDIINKALEKPAVKCYQDGKFFAKDLNNCIVNIDD